MSGAETYGRLLHREPDGSLTWRRRGETVPATRDGGAMVVLHPRPLWRRLRRLILRAHETENPGRRPMKARPGQQKGGGGWRRALRILVIAWGSIAALVILMGLRAGTYRVGEDIQPGIYAGKTRGGSDTCYWARLKGVSGELSDIIANDNAIGQFYVEVRNTDKYFQVYCRITPLDEWPTPDAPIVKVDPGTYLVGRDIVAGTYRGKAGTDTLDSCYWARLRGLSGELDDVIANGITTGQYFVSVQRTDYAFRTDCKIEADD